MTENSSPDIRNLHLHPHTACRRGCAMRVDLQDRDHLCRNFENKLRKAAPGDIVRSDVQPEIIFFNVILSIKNEMREMSRIY